MIDQSVNIVINKFINDHPFDAIHTTEKFMIDEIAGFLEQLPDMHAGIFIHHLDRTIGLACLQKIETKKAVSICETLPLNILVMISRSMPEFFRELLINQISSEKSSFIKNVLMFPEGTVGALMEPAQMTVPDDIDSGQVLKRMKDKKTENVSFIYVIRRDKIFAGIIPFARLIQNLPETKVKNLIKNDTERLFSDSSISDLKDISAWDNYCELPVIDRSNLFLGILRYQTLMYSSTGRRKDLNRTNIKRTSIALGELYRLGFTSLLRGALDVVTYRRDK